MAGQARLCRQDKWDRFGEGSPFPGLEAFDARRGAVFFGRELAISQSIERWREAGADEKRWPFLLILGASGAGKSSLLRAGVLPRLVRAGTIPGINLWRKAFVLPGIDPLLSLASALFADDALGGEMLNGDFATPEMLAKLFPPPMPKLPSLRSIPRSAALRRRGQPS